MLWAGMRHTLSAARPARAGSLSRTTVRYAEGRVLEWHSWIALLRRPGPSGRVKGGIAYRHSRRCWCGRGRWYSGFAALRLGGELEFVYAVRREVRVVCWSYVLGRYVP